MSSKKEAECFNAVALFGKPLGMDLIEFAGRLEFSKGIVEFFQQFGIVLTNGKTERLCFSDVGAQLEVLGKTGLGFQEVGKNRTVHDDGVTVAACEIHEGFAGRIKVAHRCSFNVMASIFRAGRTDLGGNASVLQAGKIRVLVGVFNTNQEGKTGRVVGRRKGNAFFTFGRNRNAGGDHVDGAPRQSRDQGIKSHVHDFDIVPGFVGNRFDQVNIKAGKFIFLRVEEFKRCKSRFSPHSEQIASHSSAGESGGTSDGRKSQNNFFERHNGKPFRLSKR
ncbi:hypothetical protein EVA_10511 [gut metagenome]|uniref:Uncharacterized protein n=1 Tax=gut metagenome TaxID=749906 RepID=J9G3F5_9ZZZZ